MDNSYVKNVERLLTLSKLDSNQHLNLDASLLQLATMHGLAGWVYYREKQRATLYSSEELAPLKGVYFQTAIHYQQKIKAFQQVQTILGKADIPIIALKGIALASDLYHDEGMRPMSDIDILVPDGLGMKALDALLNAGAKMLSVPRSPLHEQVHAHVRAIKYKGVMVEIHQRLFTLGSSFHTPGVDFFKNATSIQKQGVILPIMESTLFLYHLVTHALKGTDMGLLRLAWLLDIALWLNRESNFEQVIESVVAINPKKEKEITELIQMAAFLLPSKDQEKLIPKEKRTELLHRIAEFMQNRDIGKKHRNINMLENLKVPGLTNKVKLIWGEFFPSKEYMNFRYRKDNKDTLFTLYKRRYL